MSEKNAVQNEQSSAQIITALQNENAVLREELAELQQMAWLFSNTANGAKCSAALYSIVATAQANGMDAEQYLTELFSYPAGTIILPFNT